MPRVRSRKLRTGVFHYMVDDAGKYHACGQGTDGKALAEAWAANIIQAKYLRGTPFQSPPRCSWTLAMLRQEHLADAKKRGLAIARPQPHGKQSRLESHWNTIVGFFGSDANLDDVTQERVRDFIKARQIEVGPVPINRDLWGTLRPALGLARRIESSGYAGDPFRELKKLDEKAAAIAPIALSAAQMRALVRVCWSVDRELGAHVELLYETASRLTQEPQLRGKVVHYPRHKRGMPRAFPLDDQLRKLLASPRQFRRARWTKAVALWAEKLKMPEDDPRRKFRPHWARHTRLTIEAERPGADLARLMRWGGWKTASTADGYLHPHGVPVDRAGTRRARGSRKRNTGSRANS